MDPRTVVRFDVGGIRSKARRTSQGFLRIKANMTRVGVLTYRRQDGTTVRELRPPEEVFHEDSLASLEDAPLTDRHPPEMITSANVRKYQLGYTRSARKDGHFIAGDILAQDAGMIQKIETKEAIELSPGYRCRIDPVPGVWNGERYDQVQRDIRYNHVGMGPRGWGRSGPEVAIRNDSAEETVSYAVEVLDSIESPKKAPTVPGDKKMETVEIRVDGKTYTVIKGQEAALEELIAAKKAAEKRADGLTGQVEVLTSENAALKERADAGLTPDQIAEAVRVRVAVETKAQAILGADVKLDGLSDHEIRCKAVEAATEIKTDGRSEDVVNGMFLAITPKSKKPATRPVSSTTRVDEGEEIPLTEIAERARVQAVADRQKIYRDQKN